MFDRNRTLRAGAIVVSLAFLSSCAGIGPTRVARDRFDYVEAIADSWKSQILLNLVKTRYADAPVFLEVTSIISQYSIGGQVSAQVDLSNPPWNHAEQIGGTVAWADRPTITYAPMTGEKFAKNLLSPIPPAVIMSMVQSGWPVDFVFRLTCDSVNGVRNRSSGQMNERPADGQFEELLAAMRRIQVSDTVGVRVARKGDQDTALAFFGRTPKPETADDRAFVRQVMKLSPEAAEFQLVFGPFPKDDTEFALLSRSMLTILVELAACIDVPGKHVEEGLVYKSQDATEPCLIHIRSGPSRPARAFVAVPYKDHWFWIGDDDYASKRMLSLLMLFFSLMETGTGAGPVITVPTG